MFFTNGQTLNLDKIDDQSNGYFVEKWTNLTDAGETASNTADGGVNTDYPLFRLADVYLMYAEATAVGYNGPKGKAATYSLTAEEALNKIRERAGVAPVLDKFLGSTADFLSELRRERAVELSLDRKSVV